MKSILKGLSRTARFFANAEVPEYFYIDGNSAAAEMAYNMTDHMYVYPITPSSGATNIVDEWESMNRENVFGRLPIVREMQSEAGAISAIHGALCTGGMCTSFTSSQGLLLMLPTMFAIAGQLHPFVLHVASRSVTTNSVTILGDHNDVMAIRGTGFSMLSSRSPQECYDKALIAHLATLKSRIPICHFYDGQQVSDQFNVVVKIDPEEIRNLIPHDKIQEHKDRGLNPTHPMRTGSSIGSYNYQLNESVNPFHNANLAIIEETMQQVGDVTGRYYEPFTYTGTENPERLLISMGALSKDVETVVDYMNNKMDENVGAISCQLFRPWSVDRLLEKIPESTRNIAVLDRCKENGTIGEPLYTDVCTTLFNAEEQHYKDINVTHGRYGLGGAHTIPNHLKAVFDNMENPDGKKYFILGLNDDVNDMNIFPKEPRIPRETNGIVQSLFYGSGGDGTISGVSSSTRIFRDHTDLWCQTMSRNTPHKAGAVTVSDLRIGPKQISESYPIRDDCADFVVCNNKAYLGKIPMGDKLTEGGNFILNAPFEEDNIVGDVEELLPNSLKRKIAEKEANFYIMDAQALSVKSGIPDRINTIMMSVYFQIVGVFSDEKIRDIYYPLIEKQFTKKGDDVVDSNKSAVDGSFGAYRQVDYPVDEWKKLVDEVEDNEGLPDHIVNIQKPFFRGESQKVPISKFLESGFSPTGTSRYEKRGIASRVPEWHPEKCIQCNSCVFNCPHSVIRCFMLDNDEEFTGDAIPITGPNKGEGKDYTIQISARDCTGCFNCVSQCPVDALSGVTSTPEIMDFKQGLFNYCFENNANDKFEAKKITVQSSQYKTPYFEFPGSCAGCAETSNLKVLNQLYGQRMIIGNATGCTTVFSSYYTSSPYCKDDLGLGPAWGRSLFENAAEYGYGQKMATQTKRRNLYNNVFELLNNNTNEEDLPDDLAKELKVWIDNFEDGDVSVEQFFVIKDILEKNESSIKEDPESLLYRIWSERDLLVKPVHFIVGGDGWAYDIGFAGLDHVISTGENVNIIVLDNELYANTGGQQSKASHLGSVTKLAAGGKKTQKKDLPGMMMTYGNVYVASVAMQHDPVHALNVFQEAVEYDGPSIIQIFCPCQSHSILEGTLGEERGETERLAVESGYFPLFKYDPRLKDEGKNPFILRSKKIKCSVLEYILRERRYSQLMIKDPEGAEEVHKLLQKRITEKFEELKWRAGIEEED